MQWTYLTGKITREHQIEEHFLEYLRNLVELPQERKYLFEFLGQHDLRAEDDSDEESGDGANDDSNNKPTKTRPDPDESVDKK